MSTPSFFQTQHLILREHPAGETVAAYTAANGYRRVGEVSLIPDEQPRLVTWAISGALALHYAEDKAAPVSYVFLRSDIPARAEAMLDVLRNDLRPWHLQELIDLFDQAVGAAPTAVAMMRLAIGAPRDSISEVLRCLRAVLDNDDPRVRSAGITAAHHLLWPECRSLLSKVAVEAPDRGNRKYAKTVLKNFNRLGAPKS